MKITMINNSAETRIPTSEEIIQISKWVKEYNSAKIKANKILSTVLTVIGLILVGSIGIHTGGLTFVGLILGLLCFFLLFLCIKNKNNYLNENTGFLLGEFLVIDGYVSKIETNMDTPGCINIWFLSKAQQFNDGWYRVRQENISLDSPLILVVPNSERTKKFSSHVFSDFMLTDEGIGLHW